MTLAVNIAQSGSNNVTFRNRLINSAMVIDQRNAGASVTIPSADIGYITDRWAAVEQTDGVMTGQQSSTAPTGFTNSLKITTTTADATLGATQFAYLLQRIEGYNIADLGWGTASASAVTLSFWVQSSLTGTFGGSFLNGASNRAYPFTYTISVANTWEYKTVTIAGDTSGTWLTTNGVGVGVIFGLGVGSTYSGTAGAWAGSLYFSATGATSVVGTNGATLYITGVQLEAGTTASPFEYRQYGTELSLCQRYYQTIGAVTAIGNFYDSTQAIGAIYYPTAMRTTPTLSATGAITLTDTGANYTQSSAVFTSSSPDQYSASVRFNNLTGIVAYRPYFYNYSNSSSRLLIFSAEL